MPALPPELSDLAASLRQFPPAPATLDRDNLFFRAGQASAPRRWPWQLASACSATCALALGAALLLRPPTVERVYVPVPAPAQPVAPPAAVEEGPATPVIPADTPSTPGEAPPRYNRMEDLLIRWGFDGVASPDAPDPAPPAPTLKELLDSL